MLVDDLDQRLMEKLLSRLEKTDTCWLFKGTIRPDGYGTVKVGRKGKSWLAHRLAWLVFNQEINDTLLVCHHCDVRHCVNPNHLFQGTHKDNTRDMMLKGRHRMGITPYRIYTGEEHHSSKITYQQAEEMRRIYAEGEISFRKLGQQYGICADGAWKIIRGKRYSK